MEGTCNYRKQTEVKLILFYDYIKNACISHKDVIRNQAEGDERKSRSGKVVLQLDDDITPQNTKPYLIIRNVLFVFVA